jgi:signal transduction histidine kinase
MKGKFKDLPIKKKLLILMMTISIATLLLSSLVFVVNESITFWRAEKDKLTALADIIGANSTAALSFNDPKAAEETLSGLKATPHVISAYILTKDREVFAKYYGSLPSQARSGVPIKTPADLLEEAKGLSVWDLDLEVVKPVLLDGQSIGTVIIQSGLGELYSRLAGLLIVVLLVMGGAVCLAYSLSNRFQRLISDPVLTLAWTMGMISREKNYALRVEKQSHDEIGVLQEGFNEMLGQIQERDRALLKAQGDLEEKAVDLQRELVQRKRAEEELKEKTEELAHSNKELEQFAYVASHDLQEPLRMVTSYVQLLSRRYKGKLDADADEFIGFAVDGAARMQRLINDLLAYSRVGTRRNPFEPTDCERILQGALQNLKIALEEKRATVIHDPLPTVMADPVQLGQLFQNLVGNAIKFQGDAPPHVHVSANRNGKGWVFSVQDNGIGIAPEHVERIFVIFQRLHSREKFPGTGIGLAVCKKIVERHGGRIWVESEPLKGSTFYFTLHAKGEQHP